MTTHWLQLHLTVDRAQAPLIELLLEGLGAVAVTLGDAGDEPMLEPAPGTTPLWQATRVTGLFEGSRDADDLRSRIEQSLATDIGRHVTIERLAEQDWERAWLERFQPMQFGKRLWVRPSGFDIEQPDAVVVDLDPGLAFGTGTHPTTALCLRWLDGATPLEERVIDFGCGSGILAIAALKLGAEHVIGIDHDPQALLATRSNAERNGVADRIDILGTEAYDGKPAGLVIANILANVLIELAGSIGALVAPGGRLALSGILADQAEAVVRAYADRFDFADPVCEDGWVLLAALRRDEN
jgi:ribosomal protein L11 methyltransferase